MGIKKVAILGMIGVMTLGCFTGCNKEKQQEKQNKKNTELVEKVKDLETDGEIKEFEGLLVLNEKSITSKMGLMKSDLENFVAQVPIDDNDSRLYLVLKPAKDKKERVKKMVEDYIRSINTKLENLKPLTPVEGEEEIQIDPELQKSIDMINNYKFEEYKGYLIYISSSDNDKVFSIIKKNL